MTQKAITDGPWTVRNRTDPDFPWVVEGPDGANGGCIIAALAGPDAEANARAIAAMRSAQPTDDVRAMIKRLRAPAYWMSGSSEGHEGENDAPREAADMLEAFTAQPGQTP